MINLNIHIIIQLLIRQIKGGNSLNRIKFITFTSIVLCLLILIPAGFAMDNQTDGIAVSDDSTLVIADDGNDYYFNASAENDGSGSIDSPYKTLTPERIQDNSKLHLANGEYDFNNNDKDITNVTFIGEDAASTIIKNARFTAHTSVTLYNVTLFNSYIVSYKIFNAYNCIFENHTSSVQSAIYSSNLNCAVNIDNCTFSGNSAELGGAIYIKDGNLIVKNSRFLNNSASLFGGAICSLSSNVTLNNITARNNKAQYYGGAVYSFYGNLLLEDSLFDNNTAKEAGAVFADELDPCIIGNNTFSNNNASYVGGLYVLSSNLTSQDNIFENNFADNYPDWLNTTVPNLLIFDGDYSVAYYTPGFNGTFPSYYKLNVTPVKSQGSGGNCWSFASLAALESCILKATGLTYDFSEENMKNLMAKYSDYGWDMVPNQGGYVSMGVGYLVSWLGPVNESDDRYSGSSLVSPVLESIYHIQNIQFLVRNNYTDNDAIKRAIMDYGAVATSIYWSGSYVNKKINYYYNGDSGANHAVAIVGWDDNYSRDNFANTPPGDGAWIIKNSWGAGSGDKGFYYVSYYDTKCAPVGKTDVTYTIILNDTLKFDKNYQYDIPGKTDVFLNSSSTVWYKNKFVSTGDEYLAAVSTYFDKFTEYTLSVYVNGALKLIQNGFSDIGYHTINLNQLIPLKENDTFEVVFKITVDGEAAFPISEKISLNKLFYGENISFVSYDGENWNDLFNLVWRYSTHTYNSQVACIKAFTVVDMVNTTTKLSVNITDLAIIKATVLNQYGRPVIGGNVTFNVNGVNYVVPVSNGVAILEIYDSPKNYTVQAIYNNIGYIPSNDTIKFSTALINTTIILKVYNEYNPIVIQAIVADSEGNPLNHGNVTFTVENVDYIVDVVNGIANLTHFFNNSGLNTVTARYNGLCCNSSENTTNVTVKLLNTTTKLSVDIASSIVRVKASVLDQFNRSVTGGNVAFIVNGEKYEVPVLDGVAVYEFMNIPKNYTVQAIYNNAGYISSNDTIEFSTEFFNTTISLKVDNEYNPIVIRAIVVDSEGNPVNVSYVSFMVDNIEHIVQVVNGSAVLIYNFNNLGSNNIVAEYSGAYCYNSSKASTNVVVKSSIISGDDVKTYNSQYQFTLLDNYGNPLKNTNVTVILDSGIYSLQSDANGVVKVNIMLKNGGYVIKITNPINYETKTQNIKVVARITENKALTMYYGAGKYFKVKVFDDNGKIAKGVKVKFTVNGKTYTRTTDNLGYASIKISLKPGKYTITSEYKGFKVSNKITVKSTIITKNKSVKKGKTIKFKAKLLNKNGKILKNKKIKFKFKGKTYKVKTSKKGIATLKITKKYKKGSYTIKSTYGKLTVKNTIKIK